MPTKAPIDTTANDMRPAGQDAHQPLIKFIMALLTDPTMGALLGGGFNVNKAMPGAGAKLQQLLENPPPSLAIQKPGGVSPLRHALPEEVLTGGGAINPETFESVLGAILEKYGSLPEADTVQTMEAYRALRDSMGSQYGAGGPINYSFKTIANPKLPN